MDVVLSLRGRRGLTVVAHYSRMNIDETGLHSCQLVPTVASLPLGVWWGVDEQRRGACDRERG